MTNNKQFLHPGSKFQMDHDLCISTDLIPRMPFGRLDVWVATAVLLFYGMMFFSSDWYLGLLPIIAHLVVGQMMTDRYRLRKPLQQPERYRVEKVLQVVAWPVRLAIFQIAVKHRLNTLWFDEETQPYNALSHRTSTFAYWFGVWFVTLAFSFLLAVFIDQMGLRGM